MKTVQDQSNLIKRDSTRAELSKRIEKVLDYIHENINSSVEIRDIADVACMSEFHFIRIFSEFCGCTPYQYIIKVRIDKAKKLIRRNAFSINEISQACGYDSVQTFRKCFKRETGYSPREFFRMQLAVA
ncbi:MAG: helix-turn-helix transcriptional regulator [Bacteroidales bacterium]|nr:helix-turn-helix transcriptional regulator [Bacteroidales bacterium]